MPTEATNTTAEVLTAAKLRIAQLVSQADAEPFNAILESVAILTAEVARLQAELAVRDEVIETARKLDPLKYEHHEIMLALDSLDGPCTLPEGHMGWLECRTHTASIRARLDHAQAAEKEHA